MIKAAHSVEKESRSAFIYEHLDQYKSYYNAESLAPGCSIDKRFESDFIRHFNAKVRLYFHRIRQKWSLNDCLHILTGRNSRDICIKVSSIGWDRQQDHSAALFSWGDSSYG
jgi:hypothetical protein